jgi:HK97 gp10 family phage protein
MPASSVRAAGTNAREALTLDADAFMASLRVAVAALEIATEASLWVLALRIQNIARTLAPVDTGRLRSSITASKGADSGGVYVEIGTNVEYAIYQEFGTRYMAAQPFLRPAVAIGVNDFPAIMAARA